MAATDMREWLRDRGHNIGDRGRIPKPLQDEYERAHGLGEPGVSDADFGPAAEETEPDLPEMEPERPPRKPRSRPARPRVTERIFGAGRKPAAKKKRRPRVPVEHLVTRGWEMLSRLAGPVSLPVSRCLQVQSPVAGMILEDVVRDTVVDRALQPIARAEEKAEKMLALVGPPLLVAAIEQSSRLPAEQAAVRQAFLVPMLKESLRVWLQVAGPKVEEAARREADYQQQFGRTIDELISLFFGGTTMTAEQEPGPDAAMATAAAS
jgi:hypothetical protein